MNIKGNKSSLRPIESGDLEFIRAMINDPQIESLIVGWAWPLSYKDQQEWYANFRNSDKCIRYIIETENAGPVGLIGLRDIDWKNGSAEDAGIRIASESCRGQGIGRDAYMTMLRYAFEELRLNRVSTSALSFNTASIHCLQASGFQREGLIRECCYKNGAYHDMIIFGCLKSDYEAHCLKTGYWTK